RDGDSEPRRPGPRYCLKTRRVRPDKNTGVLDRKPAGRNDHGPSVGRQSIRRARRVLQRRHCHFEPARKFYNRCERAIRPMSIRTKDESRRTKVICLRLSSFVLYRAAILQSGKNVFATILLVWPLVALLFGRKYGRLSGGIHGSLGTVPHRYPCITLRMTSL